MGKKPGNEQLRLARIMEWGVALMPMGGMEHARNKDCRTWQALFVEHKQPVH